MEKLAARRRGNILTDAMMVVAAAAFLGLVGMAWHSQADDESLVAQARADLRAIAVAIEAYRADDPTGSPPIASGISLTYCQMPFTLTTPVAYLPAHLGDVFKDDTYFENAGIASPDDAETFYNYHVAKCFEFQPPSQQFEAMHGTWRVGSPGPARLPLNHNTWFVGLNSIDSFYDPTNGTASKGHIIANARTASGRNYLAIH